jgi:hypothetical protein
LVELRNKQITALENFYKAFQVVTIETPSPTHRRKAYLLGKEPDWQDLFHDLDAWRDINNDINRQIASFIKENDSVKVLALLGSAGSGKTTVLMRAALRFSAEGHPCFFSTSEELMNFDELVDALEVIDKRALIFMDDTEFALRWLANVVDKLSDLEKKPIFIIASRTNRFERHGGHLLKTIEVNELYMPDLTDQDIDRLLHKLDDQDLLGTLRGKPYETQFDAFKTRARKQILIAMREATTGKDFDEIIKNEYEELTPKEARLLYLCIALASAARHRLSMQQILACSDYESTTVYEYMVKNLKGIVQQSERKDDYRETRHPILAELAVNEMAERVDLKDAYIRLLPVLAHDTSSTPQLGNRIFRLYTRLINHFEIYRRFLENIDYGRAIYESVKIFVNNDYHFWLQYGSLELEFGELRYAANYISQAEGLKPNDNFILTAKGHLRYRQAKEADNYTIAERLREEGRELILDQINRRPDYSPHPFHIFGSQELAYANKWVRDRDVEEYRDIVKNAYYIVRSGLKIHYRNTDLKQLQSDLKKELLLLRVDFTEDTETKGE